MPEFVAPASVLRRVAQRARPHLALALVAAGILLLGLTPSTRGPRVKDGEGPADYRTVGFELLAGFDTWEEPYGLPPESVVIPASVRALDGHRVTLKGFMLPLDGGEAGVTEFLLNAAQDMCFFGAPVRVNDFVHVRMKSGTHAAYTHLPIVVWGTLAVKEERQDGRVVSLYRLEAEESRPGL